ncbi:lipid storage droplets surface-binding protein 1 isoform X1 [Stomoxys calcitrans]|uniref:Lipid storage droplets surface-binding protein 1 n=1 Tax=Stomoxys calcitrans TaxID=35570 RepID=A0A1I8PHA8_STOCA|nr:lipid storage droplets surface-binding protein 1 isoform X1 [Stomoxys calcitrans]
MAIALSTKIHLESIDRLGSIPLVESSLKQAEALYGKVKASNRLLNWYFETAEYTILSAYESVKPAVKLFEVPLKRLDNVMCKSLDILEQHIPVVYLPPEMTIILGLKMYWNTKEYMSDHLVKPVLKRADSVKQIRNAVLENPITTFAAERLDGALTAGDKFVDKYLVPIDGDQTDGVPNDDGDNSAAARNETGAIKAIHHGQRFSRKLKRRLTQRTLAEARALKKQSKEAIHILLYAAELIATDPKLALQKAKELWAYLSQDEPENQARPTTLEQLIVLLTRESARRVVHIVNFGANVAANIPKTVAHTSTEVTHHIIYINTRLIGLTKLDKVRDLSKEEVQTIVKRMITFYSNLQYLSNTYLERLATFLSGRIEAEKVSGSRNAIISPSSNVPIRRRQDVQDNNTPSSHNNINGVY